jgi:hypothetical protein
MLAPNPSTLLSDAEAQYDVSLKYNRTLFIYNGYSLQYTEGCKSLLLCQVWLLLVCRRQAADFDVFAYIIVNTSTSTRDAFLLHS